MRWVGGVQRGGRPVSKTGIGMLSLSIATKGKAEDHMTGDLGGRMSIVQQLENLEEGRTYGGINGFGHDILILPQGVYKNEDFTVLCCVLCHG